MYIKVNLRSSKGVHEISKNITKEYIEKFAEWYYLQQKNLQDRSVNSILVSVCEP